MYTRWLLGFFVLRESKALHAAATVVVVVLIALSTYLVHSLSHGSILLCADELVPVQTAPIQLTHQLMKSEHWKPKLSDTLLHGCACSGSGGYGIGGSTITLVPQSISKLIQAVEKLLQEGHYTHHQHSLFNYVLLGRRRLMRGSLRYGTRYVDTYLEKSCTSLHSVGKGRVDCLRPLCRPHITCKVLVIDEAAAPPTASSPPPPLLISSSN
jgi:hypothetical protein